MWRKSDDNKVNPSPGAPPSPDSAPQNAASASPSNPTAAPATVNHGIKIKGEISGHGDFLIDGEFEGKVYLPDGTFTVGPNGSVTAEIEAREIVIRGEMIGTLKARERVQISSTGRLTGDMDTRGIMIEDGAILHSKVAAPRVTAPPAAAKKVPAPQAAAPAPAAGAAPPAAPASEVRVPEALPEAKPVASPEALSESDQPPRAEIPPRAKRAAASTAPPSSKES